MGGQSFAPAPSVGVLPSAAELFSAVGSPDFLHPEATRPIAVNARHQALGLRAAQLRGEAPLDADEEGRGGAVIAAAPRLYSPEEVEARAALAAARAQAETAASGAPTESRGGAPRAGGGGGATREPRERGAPSKAMAVEDVIANPNMLLPRKRGQDRKDKEKEKRGKGQSAIGSWKSEAEMVLRQQYDS